MADEDVFVCNEKSLEVSKSNLVIQALELFREKTGVQDSVSTTLSKKIPLSAGLGGGSSNAATTLWGLNALFETNYSDQTLAQWGRELGSDVPFFFSFGRSYCEGRGEIVTPLPPKEQKHLWIAKPSVGLSTDLVFQNVHLEKLTKDKHGNDLEISAFTLMPELAALKADLHSLGFSKAQMTGSGTAFYCIGETQPVLEGVQFFPAQFITRAPQGWYKFP